MRVSPNVYPTNIERIEIAITNHTNLEGIGDDGSSSSISMVKHGKESRKPTENILYPRNTGKTYDEFRNEALRVLRLMSAWEPAVNRIHGPVSIDTGLIFYFNEEGKCGIE